AGPPATGAALPSSPKHDVPASSGIHSSSELRPGSTPPTSAAEAHVSVTESALGRRMVGHRIEGMDERFKEGTVVWFQTRAVGGVSGDTIRHVWMREGRPVQTIRLPLGGPDWRTVSRKTLTHAGSWAVEARDQDDRVLARADFACESSSR